MWTTAAVFIVLIIGVIAVLYARAYYAMRGERVVTCPETHEPVGLKIDANLAARTSLVDETHLRVADCTRWPEKKDCGQECLAQVEERPEDTLMRNILRGWYADKDCAICGRAIGDVRWHDAIPALRAPDGSYREWEGITTVELRDLLQTSLPVCSNCDQAEQFRRANPSLVVDRSDTPLRNRVIH